MNGYVNLDSSLLVCTESPTHLTIDSRTAFTGV
jgi:hypothetical protein